MGVYLGTFKGSTAEDGSPEEFTFESNLRDVPGKTRGNTSRVYCLS